MAAIHITDIEAAINFWRDRSPSPDGITLPLETRALAEVYALMVVGHEDEVDERGFPAKAWAAWLVWYDSTPDTPCIAICSTSQGDDQCKGCGRSFDEVQHWPALSPVEKRVTWRRITMEDSAWRFNKYAERARETVRANAPGDVAQANGNAADAVTATTTSAAQPAPRSRPKARKSSGKTA